MIEMPTKNYVDQSGRRTIYEGYFRDAVGYLDAEEEKIETPTLFDLMDGQDRSAG